ncbi:MAG: hypothetical protein HGN29_12045 [Asgard group archaeon]|nr:hypothetical protein [Asgard group archaeon]
MNSNVSSSFLKIRRGKDKIEYFSKGILSSSLYSIGMNANSAMEIANHVEQTMGELEDPVPRKKLIKTITDEIEKIDRRLAERYKIHEGDGNYKPIVILLAGVPGIGKSTISSRLSQRLEISSIIGTDMIREILRQTISPKLVPELHCSSYDAYKYLKSKLNPILRQSIVGYEEQCRHIIVGVEAAIQSALYSRESTIIEGVHLAPNILQSSILENPHILMFLLYLEDEEEHSTRIRTRGSSIVKRSADRYISAFSEIRNIQTYLVEEATKLGLHMIETSISSKAIGKMMDLIWDRIIELEKLEKGKEKS